MTRQRGLLFVIEILLFQTNSYAFHLVMCQFKDARLSTVISSIAD